jgi:hypothetical protein
VTVEVPDATRVRAWLAVADTVPQFPPPRYLKFFIT